jgi:hypothetical protein
LAGTYAASRCIGGIITVPIFASGGQYAGTLSQLLLTIAGGTGAIIQAYVFAKLPTTSTNMTDNGSIAISAADAAYLVWQGIVQPTAIAGSTTENFASQSLSISTNNQDTTPTGNLYILLVSNVVISAAITNLYISLSAVQDL